MQNINYYNKLATYSYEIDILKGNKYYVGEEVVIAGEKVEILDISRNGTYGNKKQYGVSDHMQAMTVAPVKDGVSQTILGSALKNNEK